MCPTQWANAGLMPGGLLWSGTEFGLFRFDGVRSIPWQPPACEQKQRRVGLKEKEIHVLLRWAGALDRETKVHN